MKEIEFDPRARLEYLEAFNFHEERRPGLGEEFNREIESALQRIQRFPDLYPRIYREVRRVILNRFDSYSLHYIVRGDEIHVLRVKHSSRNPDD